MPIEMRIWKIEDAPRPLAFEPMESEAKLEEILVQDITILSPDLFLIGSQVATAHGKFVDLLAIDDEGNIVVIELKKGKSPRDAVAQLLDYGSWAKTLGYEDVEGIFSEKNEGKPFGKTYAEIAGADPPMELGEQPQLLLVASALDPESERIMNFLSEDYGVPINAAFFRCFQDGGSQYLTRSWLLEPSEVERSSSKSKANRVQQPWNGTDFYVAFQEDQHRRWDEAVRFGFVSAGGGARYSRKLFNLFVGARIFVYIPQRGYVGIGTVEEEAVPVREFTIESQGKNVNVLDAGLKGEYLGNLADDPERAEHFVRVNWIRTVPAEDAFRRPHMYANQNVVTKLRDQATLQLVESHFGVE